ncbi:DNA/RNA non-specific endonuclease [Curvivirga aplysinae]|uniref:DNA/RNA non-specific endonuclease n=1 Tax=Curvivirga aplysinae TaxID=2529852 RepID=UPI0012BB84E4|nr:DNA/RNA non-specific endonuclease [Curvivirga aplysinae]MTI10200.1 hypothetical protein [Curvivirga aplysinae]
MKKILAVVFALIATPSLAAPKCVELEGDAKQTWFDKHTPGPIPFTLDEVIVRRGYVTAYDHVNNIPFISFWKGETEYLDTPEREGRWKSFKPDPALPEENQVVTSDYTNSGYHRGHLVPYFVSGGDRDNDGMDAELEGQDKLPIEDIDDACTVFEINYMSNIAPQLPQFNSQGGAWYDFETHNRKRLKDGEELHFSAATIFINNEEKKFIGKKHKIAVPHAFWKAVVDGSGTNSYYLFWNELEGDREFGCHPKDDWQSCEISFRQLQSLGK